MAWWLVLVVCLLTVGAQEDGNAFSRAERQDSAVVHIEKLPWEGGVTESHRHAIRCPWVIKYYHPQCGGCRALAGPFEDLAKRASKKGMGCLFGAVDCEAHASYCHEQHMSEYPAVVVYHSSVGNTTAVLDHEQGTEHLWTEIQRTCTNQGDMEGCWLEGVKLRVATSPSPPSPVESAPSVRYRRDRAWLPDLSRALYEVLAATPLHDGPFSDEDWGVLLHMLRVATEAFPHAATRTRLAEITPKLSPLLSVTDSRRVMLKSLGFLVPPTSPGEQWYGCRGSTVDYRGLPCALWQLFHSFTVRSLSGTPSLEKMGGGRHILRCIEKWVRGFFSCHTCRVHFLNMSRQLDQEDAVDSDQAAVLWLWRAHNSANCRLKGDATEDPTYRKHLFPPDHLCNTCLAGGEGQDDAISLECRGRVTRYLPGAVIDFLTTFYSEEHLAVLSDSDASPSGTMSGVVLCGALVATLLARHWWLSRGRRWVRRVMKAGRVSSATVEDVGWIPSPREPSGRRGLASVV